MVRLMLALVACATTSGQALALSSACTTVNSVYNKTNSGSFSDDLGTGFAAGETVTFVIAGTSGNFDVIVDSAAVQSTNP